MKIRQTRDTLSPTYKDALSIRYQVFVREQGVPYKLEMESPIDEAMSIHFILYNDAQKASATVRLLPDREGSQATLQRMAVLKEERGKGYGKLILESLLAFARKRYETVTLHAQLSAKDFYEKFGFIAFGEIFEEADIPHIAMKRDFKKERLDALSQSDPDQKTPV